MTAVTMTPLEEAELEWFFSAGQIAFERSPCGPMLERQDLYSIARLYRGEQRPVYDPAGRLIGHLTGISARPTAESRHGGGYTPDTRTLEKYAQISAVLKLVERQSRVCAQVLELLFGDVGQGWLGDVQFGRLGALFHLTAKGRTLLAEARKAGALEQADVKRMARIVLDQQLHPTAARAQALAYCRCQARVLEREARAAWLEVRPPRQKAS